MRNKVTPQAAAQLHLIRARGDRGLHDEKDCRSDIEETIKLDPTIKAAYAYRAWFEELDGKWNEAATDHTVALSDKNADPDNLPARAYDYARAGKKALARRDYEELARRLARKAEDYIRQDEAFHALGREEQAAAYAAARRLAPSDKWVLNGVAWFEATSSEPNIATDRQRSGMPPGLPS